MHDLYKKIEDMRADVNQLEDKLKWFAHGIEQEPKKLISEAVLRLSEVRDLLYKCEDAF